MKRFLAIMVLVLMVVSSAAAEDIDLSGLSFDQLVQLQSRITMELMQRDEWQEVTVPEGIYLVGHDIPAGKWNIKSSNPGDGYGMNWGMALGEDNNSIAIDATFNYHYCYDGEAYVLDLVDGCYLQIKGHSVIFTPFTGHSLGFK